MGFLRGMFGHGRPTRQDLLRRLAEHFVKSEMNVPELIENLPLAEGHTRSAALAEWHALMVSIMTYSLWATLGSREKVSPVLDAFQPVFLKALSPEVREIFLQIATTREKNYIRRISEAIEDSTKLANLFHLVAATITGHYRGGLEEPDVFTAQLSGTLLPDGPNIIEITALAQVISANLSATTKMFDNLQREVPRLFSGPLT